MIQSSVNPVIKIFLAIIADNLSCCGSRRKSYLIINSAISFLSIVLLMALGLMVGLAFIEPPNLAIFNRDWLHSYEI